MKDMALSSTCAQTCHTLRIPHLVDTALQSQSPHCPSVHWSFAYIKFERERAMSQYSPCDASNLITKRLCFRPLYWRRFPKWYPDKSWIGEWGGLLRDTIWGKHYKWWNRDESVEKLPLIPREDYRIWCVARSFWCHGTWSDNSSLTNTRMSTLKRQRLCERQKNLRFGESRYRWAIAFLERMVWKHKGVHSWDEGTR